MLITDLKEQDKKLLHDLVEELSSDYNEVQIVSVSTSDGFNLSFISKKGTIEDDKVAAVASTLCSISTAVSEQISNGSLKTITIESDNGRNTLLMKASFFEIDCVACIEATKNMSLAELRFISNNFVKKIKTLHLGF